MLLEIWEMMRGEKGANAIKVGMVGLGFSGWSNI